jgi:hypothetical protein
MEIVMKGQARKDWIRLVVECYIKVVGPTKAKATADFIKDITSRDTNGGKWSGGDGAIKVRFPSDLFHAGRAVFNKYAVAPGFMDDENDLLLLQGEFPDLVRKPKPKKFTSLKI